MKKLSSFKPFLFESCLQGGWQGSWTRLVPPGQAPRSLLPHLALPRLGPDCELWLEGMKPRGWMASCNSELGKSSPQQARHEVCSPNYLHMVWNGGRAGGACAGDLAEICPGKLWRPGQGGGSQECTGSLQAKTLSRHWDPTEQSIENIPELPTACPGERNVSCLASVKPQVQGMDQMEQNMGPESISGVEQPSHILYCALT